MARSNPSQSPRKEVVALVVALVVVAVVLGLFLVWNRSGFGTAPVACRIRAPILPMHPRKPAPRGRPFQGTSRTSRKIQAGETIPAVATDNKC